LIPVQNADTGIAKVYLDNLFENNYSLGLGGGINMRNTLMLFVISLCLFFFACRGDDNSACSCEPTVGHLEDIVRADCVKLSMAVDEFNSLSVS
jgi:predicted outer membrane repeat protein